MRPWSWRSKGTWYVEETSWTAITCSGSTSQKRAILSVVAFSSGLAQRQAIYRRSAILLFEVCNRLIQPSLDLSLRS